jgi:hypothetical protein
MNKRVNPQIAKKPKPVTTAPITFTLAGRTFTIHKDEKVSYIILATLLLLVVLIRSNFLLIPFERDEGAYSYYGKLLLAGKLPYRDFYEQKLPGIFYFYALIVSLFGSSVRDLHIGFTVLNLLTIAFIFLSVKRLFSPLAGVVAAITYAIVSLTPYLSGFTIQAEHGVALFTSLGIYLYVLAREKKKSYLYFLMGFALGAAFMVKTTGLFLMFWGGLILIIDFFFAQEKKYKNLISQVGCYCGGAILVVGGLLLVIYTKGTFNDMVFWVYDIPKYYVNRIPFDEGVKYFGYSRDAIVQNYKFLWVHAILALGVCLPGMFSVKTKLFVFSLAALSFLTIVPGYYFYGHYWIQLIPGVAVLSGVTFYCIVELLAKKFNLRQPAVRYAYLCGFVLMVLLHLNKLKSYYFNPNYNLILRSVYGNNPFPESMEIANFINRIAKPEDQMAVFGSEPQMYIYTNKISPTRHVFFSTIVASIPEHRQFQREFVKDVEAAKPKYFVLYRHSVSLLVQANVDQYVFQWADKYLAENYNVIGMVDMPDGQQSVYAWQEQLNNYRPTGPNVIYIYERKPST